MTGILLPMRKCDKTFARSPLFQRHISTRDVIPRKSFLRLKEQSFQTHTGRGEVSVFVPPRYDQTSGNDATPENGPSSDRGVFPKD